MLSAASVSPVSSYSAIPIVAPPLEEVSAPLSRVSMHATNRRVASACQPPSMHARAPGDAVIGFGNHLRNVDKAATSARMRMTCTSPARADIPDALTETRLALDAALSDFAPGFPKQFDVPLASDRSQRAIPPLLTAIENYEKQLRHLERTQARRCQPLSTCVAAVAVSIALGGSAIALCLPAVRATPGESDLIHPGVRICAALMAYVPLVSVGLHHVLNGKPSTIVLREALGALRRELQAYARANAFASTVPQPQDVSGRSSPITAADMAAASVASAVPIASVGSAASQPIDQAKKETAARVHDEFITVDIPHNGSHFLM